MTHAPFMTTTLTLAQDAAAAAAAPEGRTILGYIHSGGFISYILVLLSMLAVGLIITNFLILRRSAMAPDHVVDGLEPLMRERNVEGIVRFCREPANDSFLSRIIAGGLGKAARSQFGMLEIKPAIEEAGVRELDKLERVNNGIGMLAAVGPMLGLLGTVFGMIGAFSEIGGAEGAKRNAQLTGYMSVALVCTAEGLMLAIPCTFAYAMFKRRADRAAGEVGDIAEGLVAQFGAGKPAPAQPAPARPAAAPARAAQPATGAA